MNNPNKGKWYRFNDTTVEEFEMNEESLESECFGGKYKAKIYDTCTFVYCFCEVTVDRFGLSFSHAMFISSRDIVILMCSTFWYSVDCDGFHKRPVVISSL